MRCEHAQLIKLMQMVDKCDENEINFSQADGTYQTFSPPGEFNQFVNRLKVQFKKGTSCELFVKNYKYYIKNTEAGLQLVGVDLNSGAEFLISDCCCSESRIVFCDAKLCVKLKDVVAVYGLDNCGKILWTDVTLLDAQYFDVSFFGEGSQKNCVDGYDEFFCEKEGKEKSFNLQNKLSDKFLKKMDEEFNLNDDGEKKNAAVKINCENSLMQNLEETAADLDYENDKYFLDKLVNTNIKNNLQNKKVNFYSNCINMKNCKFLDLEKLDLKKFNKNKLLNKSVYYSYDQKQMCLKNGCELNNNNSVSDESLDNLLGENCADCKQDKSQNNKSLQDCDETKYIIIGIHF